MKMNIDSRAFRKDMNNIVQYSFGFLEGAQKGKTVMYRTLGAGVSKIMYEYIDSNARVSPSTLHHVYEWSEVGTPQGRLFDIDFTISNLGLTFKTNLQQSTSIKNGSRVPFYDKAKIMENGIAVTITPKKAEALRFEIGGEEIFTKEPVTVLNPGGETQGKFEQVIDTFFNLYFRQSFLRISGLESHFNNPSVYRKNLQSGKKQGRSAGIKTGFQWVASAGVGM
jgi:hypothetical protein